MGRMNFGEIIEVDGGVGDPKPPTKSQKITKFNFPNCDSQNFVFTNFFVF